MTTPPPHVQAARPAPRGMALLLVLILSAILLPFASEFAMQVHLESRTAINVTDQLMIDNEIDGQYETMLARLRWDAQENETDSYDDSWNGEELQARTSESTKVALTTHIYDELSKFNVRTLADSTPERRELQKKRLRNLLVLVRRDTPYEVSSADADTWAANIAQYVQKGPIRANLPSPRMADGRFILVLDELSFLPQVHDQDFSFLLEDQRKDDRVAPGFHRYLTVFGSGKVNLNSADKLVLQAYFPENPEMADRIIEHRDSAPEGDAAEAETTGGGDDTATSDEGQTNVFTDVAELLQVEGMTPEILEANGVDPTVDFDTRSDFFAFRILGETNTTRREELFVVERVRSDEEDEPLQGFRLLLRQERTDALEETAEED